MASFEPSPPAFTPAAASTAATADVWLLTGSRPGEVAQQRALGAALGLACKEIQVARLRPHGGGAELDTSALQAPWPRIAISFGLSLPAALRLRELSAGSTRIVHLGRPRDTDARKLDLIIPMPHDVLFEGPNVLDIRMPFNFAPDAAQTQTAAEARLLASSLPRPWTALIIGGATRQTVFDTGKTARLVAAVCARARSRGGTALISTSPRTPAAALPALRAAAGGNSEFYEFKANDPSNPLAAYLRLADEFVVTGDSLSMVAECWRSGRPLLVAPAQRSLRYRLRAGLRDLLPRSLVARGLVRGSTNIDRWLARLAREGSIGLFGRSEPTRLYRPEDDIDLQRAVLRVRALLK